MKTLTLDVRERLTLSMIVGSQKGTVADIVILSRILGKVDLTETERAEIGLVSDGLAVRWDPTRAESATRELSLEPDEAKRVVQVIRAWEQFTPGDATWVQEVLKALE